MAGMRPNARAEAGLYPNWRDDRRVVPLLVGRDSARPSNYWDYAFGFCVAKNQSTNFGNPALSGVVGL